LDMSCKLDGIFLQNFEMEWMPILGKSPVCMAPN
jgi:hypothetical protein